MESIDIPETPLSPSHPIVVTTINGGLTIKTDDEEQKYRNCIIPPYCPVFVQRKNPDKGDLPIIVANTECLNDDEWVFFGISFTSTIMVRQY